MENITFNMAKLHKHGTAFYDFLALRKRFFVDQLGWDIPHDDEVEMDQYDNPKAHYSLVLRDGKGIGGMRTMATTTQWGTHTYMLRDAVAGKLIGIPADIISAATVTPNVWECTRVVIADEVDTHAKRAQCLSMILDGVVDVAKAHGATELLALCPPTFARTLRQLGYPAKLVGDPYVNCHDKRRYVAMTMPAVQRKVAKPQAPKHVPVPKATHRSQPQPVHAPSVI